MDSFLNTYSKVKKIIINDSVLMDQNYCSLNWQKLQNRTVEKMIRL